MCLLTDAAVLAIFIISGAAASVPMTTLPRRITQDLRVLAGNPMAVAVAVLFVAGAASTLAFFPREASRPIRRAPAPRPTAEQRSELEQFMAAAPRIPLVIPRDGAKVLVVKFNDFQCPACAKSHAAYKPILAKYEAQAPGAVKVVLMDYPLNATCNPNSSMLHPAACDAAVAVRLAREHDRADADGRVALHEPDRHDAGHGPPGGARRRTGHRLRREVCRDPRARQGGRRAWHAAQYQLDADLFHQRGEGRRGSGRFSTSTRRLPTSSQHAPAQ